MADEVIVGVVGKPFGVVGELYVRPDPDIEHAFAPGSVYALPDGGSLTVVRSRLHGTRRLVTFAGVDDREAAEALRGTVLRVPRDEVPLDGDAFWVDDLLGREVVDEAGALVGVVEAVRDGHAHDYLVVARPDGGEVAVPLVADLVEITGDAVVLRAPPGLLDDRAVEA